MKLFSFVLTLALLFFQQGPAIYSQQGIVTSADRALLEERARQESERHRQAAIEINDLAGRIHSEADAVVLVDKIAVLFADTLPPSWVTHEIRQRIAHAEYAAVSDPLRRVPEQRVADVWNEYVREISASDEALVTTAELHNLRDADFATAQFLWSRGQNIWAVSTIYAVGSDGKLAEGCRPIETLRILFDLDMLFDNLRGARERVRQGVLFSEQPKQRLENAPPRQKAAFRVEGHLEAHVINNLVRLAEHRYVQQHGPYVLNGVMEKLFDELFPSTD